MPSQQNKAKMVLGELSPWVAGITEVGRPKELKNTRTVGTTLVGNFSGKEGERGEKRAKGLNTGKRITVYPS
jgi:hypothetical protein